MILYAIESNIMNEHLLMYTKVISSYVKKLLKSNLVTLIQWFDKSSADNKDCKYEMVNFELT